MQPSCTIQFQTQTAKKGKNQRVTNQRNPNNHLKDSLT